MFRWLLGGDRDYRFTHTVGQMRRVAYAPFLRFYPCLRTLLPVFRRKALPEKVALFSFFLQIPGVFPLKSSAFSFVQFDGTFLLHLPFSILKFPLGLAD